MFDDDLKVALSPDDGVRLSNNVALFLSRKVTAAQREIAHQLRTEVADHTRPETAKKEADKGRAAENNDDDADAERRDVSPGIDASENPSPKIGQLNITV